jgi:hypothetical protein
MAQSDDLGCHGGTRAEQRPDCREDVYDEGKEAGKRIHKRIPGMGVFGSTHPL